jgi:hypothetical protein
MKYFDKQYNVPRKGSPVWVGNLLRYSTGTVNEAGQLLCSNLKGKCTAPAKSWDYAPVVLAQIPYIIHVRSHRNIIDAMFNKPTFKVLEGHIMVSEGDFSALLPKTLPILLADSLNK